MREIRVTQGPFRLIARVPDDVVSIPPDGDWAAWAGFTAVPAAGRPGVLLVSVAVTEFRAPGGVAPGEMLAGMVRARHPGNALIEEFRTAGGHPAVSVQVTATVGVRGNGVGTGQAQALVAYPQTGALGVVSGVCFHADDLAMTATLVKGIAARMSVKAAAAAA